MRGLLPVATAAFMSIGVVGCSSTHRSSATPTTTSTSTSQPPAARTPSTLRSTATRTGAPCPVDPHQYTQTELTLLRTEVDRMIPERALVSIGTGTTTIGVELQPGQEALAAALQTRFRGAVAIAVGGAPFQCGTGTAPKCDALTGTDELPASMHLSLHLPRTTLSAKDTVDAQLIVTNDAPKPLRMDPGAPLVALIVMPGSHAVVGGYRGPIGGTGLGLMIHDGQHASIKTIVGAARCDGRPGSTLPPGRYGVRAGISSNEGPFEYLAPEVPITITR